MWPKNTTGFMLNMFINMCSASAAEPLSSAAEAYAAATMSTVIASGAGGGEGMRGMRDERGGGDAQGDVVAASTAFIIGVVMTAPSAMAHEIKCEMRVMTST